MTLIIYDGTGYIISQMSGDVREPIGIPFMWVEIPEGKYITGVDASVTPNVAIFESLPKSDISKLATDVDALYDGMDMLLMDIIPNIIVN